MAEPDIDALAALGMGIVVLTHECRTALQRAIAGVEMLERRLIEQPEPLALAVEVHAALEQLARVHADVRSFTAPIELELAACDLRGLVREAWDELAQARVGRVASLELVSEVGEATCEADAFALRGVFRNLFDNSLALCSDPVHVEVRIASRRSPSGPTLEITVRDNGPGVTADVAADVFEPFVSHRPGGTGLGLALANKWIRTHGGEIAMGRGPGATFVITLPHGSRPQAADSVSRPQVADSVSRPQAADSVSRPRAADSVSRLWAAGSVKE